MNSAFAAASNRSYLITAFCSLVAVFCSLVVVINEKKKGQK